MCILADSEIVREIKRRHIIIDPFDPMAVGPNSVDLRIGNKRIIAMMQSPDGTELDPKRNPNQDFIAIAGRFGITVRKLWELNREAVRRLSEAHRKTTVAN